jgi:hypothetical protein
MKKGGYDPLCDVQHFDNNGIFCLLNLAYFDCSNLQKRDHQTSAFTLIMTIQADIS